VIGTTPRCDNVRGVRESLVGEIVDTRYELRRLIARGGMGMVFEAHHKFTRRTVALKLLPEELRSQAEAHARLLREAHALTAVCHPGFVEALDAGVCAEQGPYLVLEMLEGRTLDGILAARRRLTLEDAVQVGRQICDAVAHAHLRGVVHRDIKPSNVFIARTEVGHETVKIIDLGVAALEAGQLAEHDSKLTTAHAVIGTPEYMAPEQLWGQGVDARTDVYAIGATLFECVTGETPYSGSYPEVLVRVSNATEPPSVGQRRPDVPAALAMVIEHALEKEAVARFQTAIELGRAIVAASGFPPRWSSLLAPSPGDPAALRAAPPGEPVPPIPPVKKKSRGDDEQPRGGAAGPPVRRRFLRAAYVTPVVIVTSDGAALDARSEEISEEGMLVVVAGSPVPLGAAVKARFASPMTGEMLTVDAGVRWTREARGRVAMGLEFQDAPPALRGAVARYIAVQPPPQG
jgi:eukaryotic-like serine/threonine-protein kinase